MAKGSVRQKPGRKIWYYRFYIEDETGRRRQIERPGTESKAETERMLRQAMEEYEKKRFVAKNNNLTLLDAMDLWVEEVLKPGHFSNGTVQQYIIRVNKNQAASPGPTQAEKHHCRPHPDIR